jgi:hypothetical protein
MKDFFGGDTKVLAITSDRIREYQLHRKQEGAKAATINRETSALARMFTLAIEGGKLSWWPPFPDRLEETAARQGFFEAGEYHAIREHLRDTYGRPCLGRCPATASHALRNPRGTASQACHQAHGPARGRADVGQLGGRQVLQTAHIEVEDGDAGRRRLEPTPAMQAESDPCARELGLLEPLLAFRSAEAVSGIHRPARGAVHWGPRFAGPACVHFVSAEDDPRLLQPHAPLPCPFQQAVDLGESVLSARLRVAQRGPLCRRAARRHAKLFADLPEAVHLAVTFLPSASKEDIVATSAPPQPITTQGVDERPELGVAQLPNDFRSAPGRALSMLACALVEVLEPSLVLLLLAVAAAVRTVPLARLRGPAAAQTCPFPVGQSGARQRGCGRRLARRENSAGSTGRCWPSKPGTSRWRERGGARSGRSAWRRSHSVRRNQGS